MVSILPGERTPWDLIGQSIGRNLEQTLPAAATKMGDRQALQQSLSQIKKLAEGGGSNLDISLGVMQAAAGIPGAEKYVGQVLPMILQQAEAARSQKMFGGGQGTKTRQDEDMSPPQKAQLPGFMEKPGQAPSQTDKFFPTPQGAQLKSGNMPQSPLPEESEEVWSPKQLWEMSPGFAERSTQGGKPMTVPEAYDFLSKINEQKKSYNKDIEEQQNTRAANQTAYGAKGQQALLKVMPEATDEQQAILKRKGEEYASQNKSEADIDRLLAKEAVKFKNQIANIREDLSAPRSYSTPYRKITGSYKTLDEAMKSARTKVKPLLDQGLYDTARNLLSDAGYYPEERETIINPLSDQVVSQMKQVPEFTPTIKKPVAAWQVGGGEIKEYNYTPEDRQVLKDSMKEVFNKNPGISPTLARKVYEDRGYDWRAFEQAWNDLIEEDALPNLSTDQINQADSVLKSPPLANLEVILHDIGFIGR